MRHIVSLVGAAALLATAIGSAADALRLAAVAANEGRDAAAARAAIRAGYLLSPVLPVGAGLGC